MINPDILFGFVMGISIGITLSGILCFIVFKQDAKRSKNE